MTPSELHTKQKERICKDIEKHLANIRKYDQCGHVKYQARQIADLAQSLVMLENDHLRGMVEA